MHMHAVARFVAHGFGHKRCGLAGLCRGILYYVFNGHGSVCHLGHFTKLNFYFKLSAAADFMMMVLYANAHILKHKAHAGAQVAGYILRLIYMISALMRRLVAVIVIRIAAVPVRFLRVNCIAYAVRQGLIAYVIEYMELKFRPYNHLIRYARFLHICYGALCNVSWVLIKGAVVRPVYYHNIARHRERRHRGKRIEGGCSEIGYKHHVAVFNGRVAIVAAVKAYAVGQRVLGKPLLGDEYMAPAAVYVGHFEIYHLNIIGFDKFLNFVQG